MQTASHKSQKKGFLIAVEGIDGSGKSTFCTVLASLLEKTNHTVVVTKEPGGTPLGQHIRHLLMHRETPLANRAEFLLFAADRAQHFATVVIPALQKGHCVISDRMADSSIVYQGYGHKLDLSLLATVNRWAMQEREPDVVFYLSLSAEQAHARLVARNKPLTDFEKDFEQLKHAEQNFEKQFKNKPHVFKLDAEQPPKTIAALAYNHLMTLIS